MAKTNPDEYRYRCPKGHVTIRRNVNVCDRSKRAKGVKNKPAYYCNTCKQRYDGSPIDQLETNSN